MKKKFYFFFPVVTFVLICTKTYAQQYFPFLADSNVWYVQANDGVKSDFGKTYKTTTSAKASWKYTGLYTSISLIEDTAMKKVWYRAANNANVLLYDFSLTKGDSIAIIFDFLPSPHCGTCMHSYSYYVDSIFNINTLAGPRRAISLKAKGSFMYDPYLKDTGLLWIEGVGSTAGPVYPLYPKGLDIGIGQAYFLTCSFSDTTHVFALYKRDSCIVDYGNDTSGINPLKNRTGVNSFRIIHTSNDGLAIGLDLENQSRISFSCFDIEGKRRFIVPESLYPKGVSHVPLQEISNLPEGIYLMQINTTNSETIDNQALKFYK